MLPLCPIINWIFRRIRVIMCTTKAKEVTKMTKFEKDYAAIKAEALDAREIPEKRKKDTKLQCRNLKDDKKNMINFIH